MQDLILCKQSTADELRRYFSAVLELSKSDNEFPIDLDEVWPLAYKEKGKAVRALKANFIENEDFVTLAQNGKGKVGGQGEVKYHLSLSCLEYFIARKVRRVFEVYRQVFHKTASVKHPAALPTAKELALMVLRAEEEKERLKLENKEQAAQIAQKQERIDLQSAELRKSAPKVEYYDEVLQSVDAMTTTQVANLLGMTVQKLNSKLAEVGIQFRQSGQWLLKMPYNQWRLHTQRTQPYTRSDGRTGTSTYTVWLQRGVRFIVALSHNDWSVKRAVESINGGTNPKQQAS